MYKALPVHKVLLVQTGKTELTVLKVLLVLKVYKALPVHKVLPVPTVLMALLDLKALLVPPV